VKNVWLALALVGLLGCGSKTTAKSGNDGSTDQAMTDAPPSEHRVGAPDAQMDVAMRDAPPSERHQIARDARADLPVVDAEISERRSTATDARPDRSTQRVDARPSRGD